MPGVLLLWVVAVFAVPIAVGWLGFSEGAAVIGTVEIVAIPGFILLAVGGQGRSRSRRSFKPFLLLAAVFYILAIAAGANGSSHSNTLEASYSWLILANVATLCLSLAVANGWHPTGVVDRARPQQPSRREGGRQKPDISPSHSLHSGGADSRNVRAGWRGLDLETRRSVYRLAVRHEAYPDSHVQKVAVAYSNSVLLRPMGVILFGLGTMGVFLALLCTVVSSSLAILVLMVGVILAGMLLAYRSLSKRVVEANSHSF
jgi:peptidoglycan/LPS O-acetylase OafA/YrhL